MRHKLVRCALGLGGIAIAALATLEGADASPARGDQRSPVRYEKTSEEAGGAIYRVASGSITWHASGYLCNGTETANVRVSDANGSLLVRYVYSLEFGWRAIFTESFTSSVTCGYQVTFAHAVAAYSFYGERRAADERSVSGEGTTRSGDHVGTFHWVLEAA